MSSTEKETARPVGDSQKPDVRPGSYLTVSQFRRLSWACQPVRKAFDCCPYLVGSVLQRADYHDVDLRMPMWPERGGTDLTVEGSLLLFLNCAVSDWLAAATNLPIDFQFQTPEEWASYDGYVRNPMGVGE